MVRSFVITTPTKNHSHKPMCLVIVIFYLRCCKHSQNLQNIVFTKYCSIMVPAMKGDSSGSKISLTECKGRSIRKLGDSTECSPLPQIMSSVCIVHPYTDLPMITWLWAWAYRALTVLEPSQSDWLLSC